MRIAAHGGAVGFSLFFVCDCFPRGGLHAGCGSAALQFLLIVPVKKNSRAGVTNRPYAQD
jgi:hypothetical protein